MSTKMKKYETNKEENRAIFKEEIFSSNILLLHYMRGKIGSIHLYICSNFVFILDVDQYISRRKIYV